MTVEHRASSQRSALGALFRVESARVNGLLLARCGNRSVAEELTAQTFEAAAERFAIGRGDEVTPAWLTTVALRRLVDHWRKSGRTRRLVERISLAETGVASEPVVTDPALEAALDSLPMNQRAVIALRYLDDWSVSEIADALELTYRSAESLLARGRRSLRAALEAGQ